MDPSTFQKYLRYNKRNEVTRNHKLKFCPSTDCEGILELKHDLIDKSNQVFCQQCKKNFCFRCLCPYHPGSTCENEVDKEYSEWAKEKGEAEVGFCKSCLMRIEKNGGCPNMICNLCNH